MQPNSVQFQYEQGDPYCMTLYRVVGIIRDDAKAGDEISFKVHLATEPRTRNEVIEMRLPNRFMPDIVKAFESNGFILARDNCGILDAMIALPRPSEFSVREYLN